MTTTEQPRDQIAPAPAPAVDKAAAKSGVPGWIRGVMSIVIGVLVAVVIVAPIALSSSDLVRWAESADGLGLAAPWSLLVFISLDAAAAACVGMVVYSAWRGDRGGAFGVMVWVFAAMSAAANYSHGQSTPAPHDEVFFPAMSLTGPLLLDLTLGRVRKWVKEDDGRKLQSVAALDFGGWRWVPGVAFRETFSAWRTAHREGFTAPADALAFVREVQILAELPPADQLRFAYSVLPEAGPAEARAWLARRGVRIGQDAIDVVAVPTSAPAVPVVTTAVVDLPSAELPAEVNAPTPALEPSLEPTPEPAPALEAPAVPVVAEPVPTPDPPAPAPIPTAPRLIDVSAAEREAAPSTPSVPAPVVEPAPTVEAHPVAEADPAADAELARKALTCRTKSGAYAVALQRWGLEIAPAVTWLEEIGIQRVDRREVARVRRQMVTAAELEQAAARRSSVVALPGGQH